MFAMPTFVLLADAAPAGGGLGGFLPIILMVGVFYFLVIRPQGKLEKERKLRISKLEKGHGVRLTGGILGRVASLDDQIVMVEVADKVKLKVLRAEIVDQWDPSTAAGATPVKTDAEARS